MIDWELLIPSVWIILIVLTGLISAIFLCYGYLKNKKFFLYLRITILVLIILLILQPVKNIREKLSSKPIVAVLVDSSDSMTVSDPVLRETQVNDFLKTMPFRKLKEKFELQYFSFSDKVEPGYEFQHGSGKFRPRRGKSTDIAGGLEYLHEKFGQSLFGVMLISDGIHNTVSDPLVSAQNLNVPVYTIGVGNPQPKDLSIVSVKHSEFGFKNIITEIEVVIKNSGYQNLEIPVMLYKEKEIVQSQKIKISSNGDSVVKLKFVPDTIGDQVYEVKIPAYQDEITTANNTRGFIVSIIREKMRVLYLCGQPNFEYSFLRTILKNDPSIELVSFNILRNPESIMFVPDDQSALIPFPTQEIFQNQLTQFDLLIMENFTYTRFGIPLLYLESIYRFVNEKAGGVIFIGGENAFGHGGYKNTPVEDLLPIEISGDERIEPGLFKLDVQNFTHPVTNLGLDLASAKQVWNQMSELDGYNRLGKPKPGAVVLGLHPSTKSPILAVWQKGKGRVILMAANTTWRWSMGAAFKGRNPEVYTHFWQQAIRWVTQGQEVKQVRIIPEKISLKQGEKNRIKIKVFDEFYRPLVNSKLRFIQTSAQDEKTDLSNRLYSVAPGEYWADLEMTDVGRYNFEVKAFSGDKLVGEDKTNCEVSGLGEKEQVALNETLLQEMSGLTNGKYFHVTQYKPDEVILSENSKKMPIKKKIIFWDKIYFYGLIMMLLGIEWYFRRRRGMM